MWSNPSAASYYKRIHIVFLRYTRTKLIKSREFSDCCWVKFIANLFSKLTSQSKLYIKCALSPSFLRLRRVYIPKFIIRTTVLYYVVRECLIISKVSARLQKMLRGDVDEDHVFQMFGNRYERGEYTGAQLRKSTS